MDLRPLVLALGTFAIGTGSFVFAGLLGDVAEDLSVSVGTAGQLITLYAVVYAIGSPLLVTLTGAVARRRLLIFSLCVFVGPTWRRWCFPRSGRSLPPGSWPHVPPPSSRPRLRSSPRAWPSLRSEEGLWPP